MKRRFTKWFFIISSLIFVGLVLSIVGTGFAFSKNLEPLKAIGPLFIGIFLTIIAQVFSIHYNEVIKQMRKEKELLNNTKRHCSLLLNESKQNKSDWWAISITEEFEDFFTFLYTNVHVFENYRLKNQYKELIEVFNICKKIDRMKNRVEHPINNSDLTRSKIEIRKEIELLIEKIRTFSKTLD